MFSNAREKLEWNGSSANRRIPNNNEYLRNSPAGNRQRAFPSTADTMASSSTLLPTTFSSLSSPGMPSSRLSQQLRSNTCSHFLLGGNYYPGKDKKRRQLKRRTLWYRLFCASPWRKSLSFIISGYLLLFNIIKPFASHLAEYGNFVFLSRRRKGLHGTWLLFDESLLDKITNVEEERAEAIRIMDERQRLQFGSEQRHAARLATFERIVPGWYHRNDENAEQSKVVEEKLIEAERQMDEREAKTTKKMKSPKAETGKSKIGHTGPVNQTSNPNNNKELIQATNTLANLTPHNKSSTVSRTEKRKLTKASSKDPNVIRTIHNMHLYRNKSICPQDLAPADIRITLVVQSTLERLWILKRTCQRWKDPIIVALFLNSRGDLQTEHSLLAQNCPQLTVIHHVKDASLGEDDNSMYPVNRLRNLGLDAVKTSHVLMVDIDFVPSSGLAELIRSVLLERNSYREQAPNESILLPAEDKDAIVVPAFERIPPSELCQGENCSPDTYQTLANLSLPRTFEQLRSCVLERNQCRVFQSHNNWDGHSSTRSEAWLHGKWYNESWPNTLSSLSNSEEVQVSANHSARIRSLTCFDSVRYEPYVVLRWCPHSTKDSLAPGPVAPYYDERFHGYGKNKIQLISHLRVMGYTFSILPEGFIIHTPHSTSKAKAAWESPKNSSLHSNMDHLYPKFLKELLTLYKQDKHKIIERCQG